MAAKSAPGQEDYYDHWGSIHRVENVMIGNARELLGLIDALSNDVRLVISVTQNSPEPIFDEIIRLAHNYLSSRQMLVDHTRNTIKGYRENPVLDEYNAKVKALAQTGAAAFLQRLRNYLIHYRVLPLGLEMKLEGAPSMQVFLDRDSALSFDGWTRPDRAFIEQQGEKIGLKELVTTDLERMGELYGWLYQQIGALHPHLIRGSVGSPGLGEQA